MHIYSELGCSLAHFAQCINLWSCGLEGCSALRAHVISIGALAVQLFPCGLSSQLRTVNSVHVMMRVPTCKKQLQIGQQFSWFPMVCTEVGQRNSGVKPDLVGLISAVENFATRLHRHLPKVNYLVCPDSSSVEV